MEPCTRMRHFFQPPIALTVYFLVFLPVLSLDCIDDISSAPFSVVIPMTVASISCLIRSASCRAASADASAALNRSINTRAWETASRSSKERVGVREEDRGENEAGELEEDGTEGERSISGVGGKEIGSAEWGGRDDAVADEGRVCVEKHATGARVEWMKDLAVELKYALVVALVTYDTRLHEHA